MSKFVQVGGKVEKKSAGGRESAPASKEPSAQDKELERQMEVARRVMKENHNLLRRLANS